MVWLCVAFFTQTEDAIFDGVPVRIYTPAVRKEIRPGFVFIHGGGWVLGSVGK